MDCSAFKIGRTKFLKIAVLCLSSNPVRIKAYDLRVPPQFRIANNPNPVPVNGHLTTVLEKQQYCFAYELAVGIPSPVSEDHRRKLRQQQDSTFQIECTYENISDDTNGEFESKDANEGLVWN
eukprot:TRINITY_DN9396_c0_g1_i1.p2 TRINITY_DN9396_c0_g1~~TRINITY_DN9396_c0_g1_i1.p2  ORF type:complete len:123 (+),score=28.54 TRINITY_DN9396_c0_g1_i1:850-1218(+)